MKFCFLNYENVKVKLSPCLTKHHAMNTYAGIEALDGGDWSASRPGRFTPEEAAHCSHWIGGWAGSRGDPGGVLKRQKPLTFTSVRTVT
jgi:hypothetical protein